MWQQIPDLCSRLQVNDEIRVVVLRGEGSEAFVAGADISEFEQHRVGPKAVDYDAAVAKATDAIANLPMPVVASIQGFCIGGGLALAMAADLRYCSNNSTFGLPPARLGIGYSPSGLATLVDLVGPARSKELLFTADFIDAPTALGWGLVNDLVAPEDLDAFVAEKVRTISSRAPLTQVAAKLAIVDYLDTDGAPSTRALDAVKACARSHDYAEGVAAFIEKRSPHFQGR